VGKAELDIDIRQEGPVTVFKLSGPVDSANFAKFKRELARACMGGRARVVVDCEDLTYMNSKGFGVLTMHYRGQLSGKGELVVCGLNRKLVKTMDLLGLGGMLKMYLSVDDAVSSLSTQSGTVR
jgi:anti-anti-sigma factor